MITILTFSVLSGSTLSHGGSELYLLILKKKAMVSIFVGWRELKEKATIPFTY